jgi:diaminopimelate decarboxylase/aspartate kinase
LSPSRWVVLKLGPASVSTPERWRTAAALARRRLDEGFRPLFVLPALPGMPERLWGVVSRAAETGSGSIADGIAGVERSHLELARRLGLGEAEAAGLLRPEIDRLRELATSALLQQELRPAVAARAMAVGELLLSRLGAAWLEQQGLPVSWHDARTSLIDLPAPDSPGAGGSDVDPALLARLEETPGVVVTQGGIAAGAQGGTVETVRLGHGGADLSAAWLAVRLGAERCEVWTEVPGLFTADPALLPSARLLRSIGYEEAQEILAAGGRALDPRAVPPLRRHGIPLHIGWLDRPEAPGTVVSASGPATGPQVKAVSVRTGMTLVSMETVGMWREVGFLARVFEVFGRHRLSVGAVSTSETSVTATLDPDDNLLDDAVIRRLLRDLRAHCEARVIAPAAALSLVGRGIRAILHELGPVLEVFEEMKVHLLTQSADDLNLTFVVDEDQAERLVRQLHGQLFQHQAESPVFGPTWDELVSGHAAAPAAAPAAWWRKRRDDLLALVAEESPLYVYDAETLDAAARAVLGLGAVDRVFYSVKANHHPGVLARFHDLGIGFECVSAPELEHVRSLFPGLDGSRLLFTPNFAPREEYLRAFELGAAVTVDSLHALREWPEVFAGRELFLRLDPGRGKGHHAHVRTAGAQSKFGISPETLEEVPALAARCGARVVGLHAHAGSGIRTADTWQETARFLASAASLFPHLRVLDLGGGLGVPERPGQAPLDLAALDESLSRWKASHPGLELWMEPGRYLVATAGVLLARVVQVKRKGEVLYIGAETGMNSLIRPALYGAYHPIVNLSRLDEPSTWTAHIVGPICETGDVLGRSRRIAPAAEGDVLLIANAGAYGRVMSSSYNMRQPAGERVLEPRLQP